MKISFILTAFMLVQTGMVWSQPSSPAPRRGLIIVIGGVGGMDLLSTTAHLTLPRAGVPHEFREFVWTHGKGRPFTDLRDVGHLRHKAEELADLIRMLKAEDPSRPIFILAKSGGTALALMTAELLPANTLERIVLLSAAVSPTYDLRRAMLATRGEIVSFFSPNDQLILNLGTRSFGTMDRVFGPGAGLHGFRLPESTSLTDADRDLYRRLVQISWSPRMLLELNHGSHVCTALPTFLAAEVAPWLR